MHALTRLGATYRCLDRNHVIATRISGGSFDICHIDRMIMS